MRRFVIIIAALSCLLTARAQKAETGQVEVFSGAELSYADVNFVRLYDVLLNLTPGIKWHMGNDWLLSAQAFVPIVNEGYETKHNLVRLTNASLAKQLHLGSFHMKLSGGLFGLDRYGLDLRAMLPLNSWLMLYAQAGYTGYWRLATGDAVYHKGSLVERTPATNFGSIDRLTGIGGASIWLEPWHTEFRISGGRYANEDFGGQVDVMRHFPGCTVGLYAQLHQRKHSSYREAGGFKVVMLLPQPSLRRGKLVVRPASNFRLTYNAQADNLSMKMYTTDPEENERDYPIDVNWGLQRIR